MSKAQRRAVSPREQRRRREQARQSSATATSIAAYAAQRNLTNDTRRRQGTARHTRRYVKAARRTYDGE